MDGTEFFKEVVIKASLDHPIFCSFLLLAGISIKSVGWEGKGDCGIPVNKAKKGRLWMFNQKHCREQSYAEVSHPEAAGQAPEEICSVSKLIVREKKGRYRTRVFCGNLMWTGEIQLSCWLLEGIFFFLKNNSFTENQFSQGSSQGISKTTNKCIAIKNVFCR